MPRVVLPSDVAMHMKGSNYQRILVALSPDEYLKLAHSEFVRENVEAMSKGKEIPNTIMRTEGIVPVSAKHYEAFYKSPQTPEIREKYIKGEPLHDTPILHVEGIKTIRAKPKEAKTPFDRYFKINVPKKGLIITGHEGRNRALIAKQLGIKKIPVFLELHGLKNWREYEKAYVEKKIKQKVKRRVIVGNREFMV